jgi:hypothetical protein
MNKKNVTAYPLGSSSTTVYNSLSYSIPFSVIYNLVTKECVKFSIGADVGLITQTRGRRKLAAD